MSDQSQPTRPALTRLLLVLVPLAAMLGAFVWIASLDPLRSFNNGAPAVEALTVERTILDETGIGLLVRAGGETQPATAIVSPSAASAARPAAIRAFMPRPGGGRGRSAPAGGPRCSSPR